MSAKPKHDTPPEYASLIYTAPKMPIVYGPEQSRRLGTSLGVNLLGSGPKVCSFDCPYCNLGTTQLRLNKLKTETIFPSLEEIDAALTQGFRKAHESTTKIDTITISGNGEPTLHPFFVDVVDMIIRKRNEILTGTPIKVLTNGANIDSRRISESLNKLEERMVKFDAGNERVFKTINSPLVRASVSKILAGVKPLKDVIVQSFFVQGSVDNTLSADLEDWMEVIGLIRPKFVHIHGMNRVPAASGLKACDEDTLYTIASRLERRTQIRSLVFP